MTQLLAKKLPLLFLGCTALLLTSCLTTKAQIARETRVSMAGMTHSQILACMGMPVNKSTGNGIEVWSYLSGKPESQDFNFLSAPGAFMANGGANGSAMNILAANGTVMGSLNAGSGRSAYCITTVTFQGDKVIAVNYEAPDGGPPVKIAECADALESCAPKQ